jgi:succinoglycan biosynthesis protein ExoO
MENPLVSVIIPTYNVEKYIKQCIDSVLVQTYPHFEIILVDDCSTDNTVNIIKSYKDSRIRLLINDVNKGPSYSRNRAIEASKGEWIAFLDSDDWWDINRLQKLISCANETSAEFIADDIYLILDGKERGFTTELKSKGIFSTHKPIKLTSVFLVENDLGMQPMIKKQLIKNGNIKFDEDLKYGEDFKFYVECLEKSHLSVLFPVPYYYYRVRNGSLTTNRNELITQAINMTETLIDNYKYNSKLLIALYNRKKRLVDLLLYYEFISKIRKSNYLGCIRDVFEKPRIINIFLRRLPRILKHRIFYKFSK